MVDRNFIIGVTLGMLVLVGLGALVGWIYAKIRYNMFLKKLDEKIHTPEEIERYIELWKDQKQSEIIREESQDERRRNIRGNGNIRPTERVGDIQELIRGKPTVTKPTGDLNGKRTTERPNNLQDTTSDEIRVSESDIKGTDRDTPEDEQEFDWSW